MKHIYTIIAICFLASSFSYANTITFTSTSGDWSTASNWSLNRVPANGDSIIIPQGKSVMFDKNDSLANVYIKVSGTLTIKKKLRLNAGSIIEITLNGTITALGTNRLQEQITLNNVNKYDEKAPLNVTGPAYAALNSGVSPVGFSIPMILPVTFNSFFVSKSNSNIVLDWSTSEEMNNKGFEVQRSFDGRNYTSVAVLSGAGNSGTIQQYRFVDKNMTAPVAYYRIAQADVNGKMVYSAVKIIRTNGAIPVTKIYANSKSVNVEFNQPIKNAVTIRLFNTNGQLINQLQVQKAAYRITLNAGNCQSGMYIVQVSDGAAITESTKVML